MAAKNRSTRFEPGGARGGEVHMNAWMPYQPAPDDRRLVSPVVIHDQVDIQAVRHIGVDVAEERTELVMTRAVVAFMCVCTRSVPLLRGRSSVHCRSVSPGTRP